MRPGASPVGGRSTGDGRSASCSGRVRILHSQPRKQALMRVAMIGTGYVGLVSGACFADFGHDVVCIDKDDGKIEQLRAGRMPIYEPGLGLLVARNVEAGRLTFTVDGGKAVAEADAVFVAVGTPSRRGDGY